MGALYLKDKEAGRLAETLAKRRGLTKTAAVKLALVNELERDEPKPSIQEVLEELWRTSPIVHDPSVVIDKAFYDSLNDEEDD